MLIFILTIVIVIFLISIFLTEGKRNKTITFFFLFFGVSIIYFFKGNIESFLFYENNEIIVEDIVNSNDGLENLDPNRLIIYLEEKLKRNPKDKEGWLVLARACSIAGYLQKADLYFKEGLKEFPLDKNLLFEYAILKKNTDQFKSSLKLLAKLKQSYPNDLTSRELIINIFTYLGSKELAKKEFEDLKKMKNIDQSFLKKINDKYELD